NDDGGSPPECRRDPSTIDAPAVLTPEAYRHLPLVGLEVRAQLVAVLVARHRGDRPFVHPDHVGVRQRLKDFLLEELIARHPTLAAGQQVLETRWRRAANEARSHPYRRRAGRRRRDADRPTGSAGRHVPWCRRETA